jgi:hypothetical protein
MVLVKVNNFNFYWMLGKAKPTIKIGGSKVYFATAQFLLEQCFSTATIKIGCFSEEKPTIFIR